MNTHTLTHSSSLTQSITNGIFRFEDEPSLPCMGVGVADLVFSPLHVRVCYCTVFANNCHEYLCWIVHKILTFFQILNSGFRALNLWPEKLPKGTRGSDYMSFDIVAGLALST